MWADDAEALQRFLYFGYLPDADSTDPLRLLAEWSRRGPAEGVRSASVQAGAAALLAAVRDCASTIEAGGDHVVFLSGGLDSRAIFAGLLECFDRREIVAATFGQPGEQDFDFASAVARRAGVRHETLRTFEPPWTVDDLVASVLAREMPFPFPFGQRYLSYRLHQAIGRENTFWDGLGGGPVSGSHLPLPGEVITWDSAVGGFVRANRLPGAERLVPDGFDPRAGLPEAPFIEDAALPYPDQLDFALRQDRYIATRRLRDFTLVAPLLNRHWLDFMFAVPYELRLGQRFYIEVLTTAFPRVFSLPATTTGGLSPTASRVRRLAAKVSKRAWAAGERFGLPSRGGHDRSGANWAIHQSVTHDPRMRGTVSELLSSLSARGCLPWVDVDLIAHEHFSGERDHVRILMSLVALELNLQARARADEAAAS